MKYLSIITNFGCHGKCPYCIVKKSGIDVPATTIESLDKLLEAVKISGADIVSVSGGGDPLHNYEKHHDYYDKLFEICNRNSIPLEVHTSYFKNDFPTYNCVRMVYHLQNISDLCEIQRKGSEIIRVVYVVTPYLSENHINDIYQIGQECNIFDELSFRQMVDGNFQPQHYYEDYLKKYHGDRWYYIEQCDYNDYFVEGRVYHKFSEIHK